MDKITTPDVAQAKKDVTELERLDGYGLRWATKTGYIGVWQRIHHAEEALIQAMGPTELWDVIESDRFRLQGAKDISPALAPALEGVARFLATGTPGAGAGPAPAAAATQDGQTAPPVVSMDDTKARLREVTAAINAFRDDTWSGIVRIRNQLLAALCLTEVFAYAILALVVTLQVGPDQVIAGITFFLLAAVVGFFGQLVALGSATPGAAVDDYGLALARLLLIPVVSGLAGLGGVLVMAMLFNASVGALIQGASASRAAGPMPSLSDVFDLDRNRAVIFAILFGYAPSLLVSRLDSLVSQYKAAISSTESGTTTQGGG